MPDDINPNAPAAPVQPAPIAAPVAPPVATAPQPAAPPPAPAVAPPAPAAPSKEEEEKRASDIRAREHKKAMKAAYGTDDPAEIERIQKQREQDAADLARLRGAEQKAQRDNMTEVQRLQTDLDAANRKVAELEAQIESLKSQAMNAKQQSEIAGRMMQLGFDPDQRKQRMVMRELGDHVKSLTKTQLAVFGKTGGVDKWLKEFLKENPSFARPTAPAPAAPPKAPVTATPPKPAPRVPAGPRQPVPPAARPPTATDTDPLAGKTVLPGRPNSMTPEELRQHRARAQQSGHY